MSVLNVRMLGYAAKKLQQNIHVHALKRYSHNTVGKFPFASKMRCRCLSTSRNEPKFHPPYPTVMQRLTQIEDNLRFRGYSTVRIGLVLLLVTGERLTLIRDHIHYFKHAFQV